MSAGWAAAEDAAAHVVRPDASLDDLVTVDGDDGHHLADVRRLRVGERITVADGDGRWRCYEVTDTRARALSLRAVGSRRREPGATPRLAVAFALTKGSKPELVVQKLTELGVDRILPVVARRSIARPSDARTERLVRVVREAAAQSRRARLPDLAPVGRLADLAGHPGVVVAARDGSPEGGAQPAGGEWLLVVGPEGGLEDDEVAGLHPVRRLAVGPNVLRAESAAIAAAAVLVHERAHG